MTAIKELRRRMRTRPRRFVCRPGEEEKQNLGPLGLLPGTWKSEGKGWNMIALPFENAQFRYRLLMNQYDEFLRFSFVDDGVPNRGVTDGFTDPDTTDDRMAADQFIASIDYEQTINQVAQKDAFVEQGSTPQNINILHNDAGLIGSSGDGIHHEPGLWLHMIDDQENGNNIARLATIPHGNSVLAIGKSSSGTGTPEVPSINGLPVLDIEPANIDGFYLAPYKHFETEPFFGNVPPGLEVDGDPFPGFFPTNAAAILQFDNRHAGEIVETIKLDVGTDVQHAGISNIPFIERQADAVHMRSTFWIQKLQDESGKEKLRLQYIQNVRLDFFPRLNDIGLIQWPHISINTLEKVSDNPDFERESQCKKK